MEGRPERIDGQVGRVFEIAPMAVAVPLQFDRAVLDEVRREVEALGGELVILDMPRDDLARDAAAAMQAEAVLMVRCEVMPPRHMMSSGSYTLGIMARVHHADLTGHVSHGAAATARKKLPSKRCLKCSAIVPDGQRCPQCGGKRTH